MAEAQEIIRREVAAATESFAAFCLATAATAKAMRGYHYDMFWDTTPRGGRRKRMAIQYKAMLRKAIGAHD